MPSVVNVCEARDGVADVIPVSRVCIGIWLLYCVFGVVIG